MKITTITVSDSRQLPDGSWKKIEWVAELGNDDVAELATTALKERIEERFYSYYGIPTSKHNPQLYTETPIHVSGQWLPPVHTSSQWESTQTIKNQPHSTIEAINSCTTLKVLQEFDLIVQNMSKKYPEIAEAYDNKLLELSE